MQECQACQDQLTDYLYGELPEPQRRQVEAHLERCDRCREELQAFRRTFQWLEMEPELAIPAPVKAHFEEGVYRKIARQVLEEPPDVSSSRRFRTRFQNWLRPSWLWVTQTALMAASLAFGIWIGASQFQPAPPLNPSPTLAQIPSAQERLAQHWEQEMEAELDEARAQRYLRGDLYAALSQYAQVSELGVNPNLATQADVARDELTQHSGI